MKSKKVFFGGKYVYLQVVEYKVVICFDVGYFHLAYTCSGRFTPNYIWSTTPFETAWKLNNHMGVILWNWQIKRSSIKYLYPSFYLFPGDRLTYERIQCAQQAMVILPHRSKNLRGSYKKLRTFTAYWISWRYCRLITITEFR